MKSSFLLFHFPEYMLLTRGLSYELGKSGSEYFPFEDREHHNLERDTGIVSHVSQVHLYAEIEYEGQEDSSVETCYYNIYTFV